MHKKTLFSFNSKHQVTTFETLVIISVPFFQLSNRKSLYYKTCQFFNNIVIVIVLVTIYICFSYSYSFSNNIDLILVIVIVSVIIYVCFSYSFSFS